MCQLRMVLNMVIIVSSWNSLMVMVLRCLKNLGVIAFRPPPGGPIAPINCKSISFIAVVSLRSYLN